jgi:hypothetical protein
MRMVGVDTGFLTAKDMVIGALAFHALMRFVVMVLLGPGCPGEKATACDSVCMCVC